MSVFQANLPNLVIASGATTSNAINTLEDLEALTIYAPSALTGVITVQVSPTSGTASDFVDATSGGSDITIGAGNAVTIDSAGLGGALRLRLSSTLAEAAERVFPVTKSVRVR